MGKLAADTMYEQSCEQAKADYDKAVRRARYIRNRATGKALQLWQETMEQLERTRVDRDS